MKFFTKSILALVLILVVSCKSDQSSNKILESSIIKYGKLEKKHKLHINILETLEELSQSQNLDYNALSKDTIVIKDNSNKLVYFKDKLTSMETARAVYLINSEDDINVQFNINDSIRKGYLKNAFYNGYYIDFDKTGYQELRFKNNDTLFLKEYYNDNTIRKTINYKDNKPNGIQENFHPNGQLAKQTIYSEGVINGEMVEWFDTGKIKSKVNYVNGLKQGEEIHYFKDTNSMQTRENYKDGKLNGQQVAWYDNANLKHKVNFKNGKLNGEMILYQENQSLMKMKGNYLDDFRNGDFKVWNENGNIIVSAKLELGKFVEIKTGTEETIQGLLSEFEMDFF